MARVRLLLFAVCALLLPRSVAGAETIPRFESADCMVETGGFWRDDSGVECGYVIVPEARYQIDPATGAVSRRNPAADQANPTIRLATVILRGTGPTPAADPLFVAQGGPGSSTIETYYDLLLDHSVRDERDIVLFDQRGTLYSEPNLLCPELTDALPELLTAGEDAWERIEAESVAACHGRLMAEGVNLSAYNSLENAADVEAVRQALGYDEVNFYGVSYGTLLGLHLMRDFPAGLRTVILDGVVPPQENFITRVFQSEERVFREFFATCRAEPLCNDSYPDLETRFERVVATLNEEPVSLLMDHPDRPIRIPVLFTGDDLVDFLYQMFYLTGSPAILPKVIVDADAGRLDVPAAYYPSFLFADTFSDGMYNSVICTEDADFLPGDAALEGVRPLFAAGAADELGEFLAGCSIWAVPTFDDSVDAAVVSDIPTLLLSGRFDPITPPGFASTAATTLSNSRAIVLPNGGHGVALGVDPCIDAIVGDFLTRGTPDVDTGCLAEETVFNYVSPDVRVVPLLGRLTVGSASAQQAVGIGLLCLAGLLSMVVVWPSAWLLDKLRRGESIACVKQRRLERWVALAFTLIALLLIGSIIGLFVTVAFLNYDMALLSALPAWAGGLSALVWLLVGLAAGMVVGAVVLWVKRTEALWARLYYLVLTCCAVALVYLLIENGLGHI